MSKNRQETVIVPIECLINRAEDMLNLADATADKGGDTGPLYSVAGLLLGLAGPEGLKFLKKHRTLPAEELGILTNALLLCYQPNHARSTSKKRKKH